MKPSTVLKEPAYSEGEERGPNGRKLDDDDENDEV
jgi:hypothetical protein